MKLMKVIVGVLCFLVAGSFFLGRATKECLPFDCPEEKECEECFNPDNCPELVECPDLTCLDIECEDKVCPESDCQEVNCPNCEDCSLLVDQDEPENKETCSEKQWYDGRRIDVQVPC